MAELAAVTAIATVVLGSPLIATISYTARRRGLAIGVESTRRARVMHFEAERRAFENQLGRGLDMAEDEDTAFDVIERIRASLAAFD